MWQKVNTASPASASALHSALSGKNAEFTSKLEEGQGALGALGLPSGAAGEVAERSGLTQLLAGALSFLGLTPYSSGERIGDQHFLTPEQALTIMQKRLEGVKAGAALLLLLPAHDAASLSKDLAALCALYPIPELRQLLRQAGAWATLESDKFTIPDPVERPSKRPSQIAHHPDGRKAYDLLDAECAFAEAVEQAKASPLAKLQSFKTRRENRLQTVGAAFEALVGGFGGKQFEFYASYLEGAAMGDLGKLGKSAPVTEVYKNCSVLCWLGEAENLKFLKELLGV